MVARYADAGRLTGGSERTQIMGKYESLNEAMEAGDELAEAEIRYGLLAEAFTGEPKLRSQLAPAIERAKAEIVRLRALGPKSSDASSEGSAGKVIGFDANRFRKSG